MRKLKRRVRWTAVNLCRLLLAFTFIFSGTVKLIDPQGVQYKLEDYALVFSLTEFVPTLLIQVAAILLGVMEFMLGIYMLFGIRRRVTATMMLAFMLVMTPLTLYLALRNPVQDCGCFGEAVVLTNWQTFWKNVVLLVAVLVIIPNLRRLTRFITERNQWVISLYSLLFSLSFAFYNLYYLPVVDFRPYHVGADVLQGLRDEWEGKNLEMKYSDFSIQMGDGSDITEQWLAEPGYKFLLVAPWLERADDSAMDRVNDAYDYCQLHGYPFLCLTSSGDDEIMRWCDYTGAEYPFALTDGTVLKTMVRSNPGLVLLYGSVIVKKWPYTDFPQIEESTPKLEQLEQLEQGLPKQRGKASEALSLLLLFVVPLLLFSLLDRLWIGSKFYKKYKIRHTILKNVTKS